MDLNKDALLLLRNNARIFVYSGGLEELLETFMSNSTEPFKVEIHH